LAVDEASTGARVKMAIEMHRKELPLQQLNWHPQLPGVKLETLQLQK
jgi:hypothetical protein